MKGYVHSIESFGTVDGPGIRYVVFLQGCPMRCQYCHNPDTWEFGTGTEMDTEELLAEYESYRPFLKGGGLTVTGGEPLLQIDYVIELFEKAHLRDIHTCIDTSGITFSQENTQTISKFDKLMEVTDLVMLDIKHIDSKEHKQLTAQDNSNILAFADYLDMKHVPVWIRHVVVPSITDKEDALERLGYFIGGLSNIKALDVLPYHDMGKVKYEQLGMDYPLSNIPPLSQDGAISARQLILKGMKRKLREQKSDKIN